MGLCQVKFRKKLLFAGGAGANTSDLLNVLEVLAPVTASPAC
jgi:hypothetical protein